jgi:hypothetical protein
VLALERGTLVTARFENRRLALVGVIGMAPRTTPAWPIWLPEYRPILLNRPAWKSAPLTPEIPLATREFL